MDVDKTGNEFGDFHAFSNRDDVTMISDDSVVDPTSALADTHPSDHCEATAAPCNHRSGNQDGVRDINDDDEDDEDDVLRMLEEEAEMDDDHMLSSMRERRMEELRKEAARQRDMKQIKSGQYDIVRSEKDVLAITTSTDRCVVHFSHKDFRKCRIMDSHLESLAKKHFRTRFVKLDVADAPFLVERLKIQVLPCVIAFVDGITVDRLVGFDGLTTGERDDFPTSALERRLSEGSKVISMEENRSGKTERRGILGFASSVRSGGDDGDDDDDD